VRLLPVRNGRLRGREASGAEEFLGGTAVGGRLRGFVRSRLQHGLALPSALSIPLWHSAHLFWGSSHFLDSRRPHSFIFLFSASFISGTCYSSPGHSCWLSSGTFLYRALPSSQVLSGIPTANTNSGRLSLVNLGCLVYLELLLSLFPGTSLKPLFAP